jgi:hypothetical protein
MNDYKDGRYITRKEMKLKVQHWLHNKVAGNKWDG